MVREPKLKVGRHISLSKIAYQYIFTGVYENLLSASYILPGLATDLHGAEKPAQD